MSIVNAVTIVAENLQSANIATGNAVTFTVVANQITVSTGNITANSTVLKLDNSSSPIFNTAINTTSISASAIELNGVEYTTMAPSSPAQPLMDYQVFTNPIADNKWYKPSWAEANDVVTIMMWGAGGAGARGTSGGGGGACVIVNKLAGECNSVCNVVVGAGGTVVSFDGTAGGNSIFWANSTFSITAYGGGGGGTNPAGGGGWFSAGATNVAGGAGGGPLGGSSGTASTFGGGGGGATGGVSVYGGGGGGSGSGATGGNSIYGGGGGAQGTAAAGISIFGGNGGNNGIAASAPGGGGAASGTTNGARGEVRITTTKSAIGGDITPAYSLTVSNSVVYESNTISFTVSTFNVADGTTLYYTLNNSSTATSSDFTTAVNGSIVINGGANTFTLTANNDTDANEIFFMDLRTNSSSGPIVANTSAINLYTPATVTYTDSEAINNSQTSFNFGLKNIGTASSDRYVIVTVAGTNENRTISSVTIGGITATEIGQITGNNDGGTAYSGSGIYMAAVPTGTTAIITVTFSGARSQCGIGVYAVTNLKSTTPIDVKTSAPSTTVSSVSSTLTTKTGGFIIATAASKDNGITSWSWTNATENYDITIRGAERATAGATATTSSDGSVTITATPNITGQATFVTASFQ